MNLASEPVNANRKLGKYRPGGYFSSIVGFLVGITTLWATLAIWQRIPPFASLDFEPDGDPELRVNYCLYENCSWRNSLPHVDHEVSLGRPLVGPRGASSGSDAAEARRRTR